MQSFNSDPAAESVYEQYNDLTSRLLAEGVETLSNEELIESIFASVTTTLIRLAVHFDVPKGRIVDAVAGAYDFYNWNTHGGNNVSRQQ